MLQVTGGLGCRNVRLLRLSEDWKCKGPTHGVLDLPPRHRGRSPREIAHIVDLGDGGCKKDKFERDARLLEEGLREEPENERYCLLHGEHPSMSGQDPGGEGVLPPTRLAAGGWVEEVWYSLVPAGQAGPGPGRGGGVRAAGPRGDGPDRGPALACRAATVEGTLLEGLALPPDGGRHGPARRGQAVP
jgi:hypothetical protein